MAMHRLPTGKSIIAGWGRNEEIRLIGTIRLIGSGDFESSGAYTPNLLKAEVPVLNGTQCKKDYLVFKSISSEKHLCAGGTGEYSIRMQCGHIFNNNCMHNYFRKRLM